MAFLSLLGLGRGAEARSGRAWHRRPLRLESLESRLALAAVMEVKVQATDLSGNPITSVEVGDEVLLTGTVQDLRPDAQGVFAAYVDVAYDPSKVAVNGGITHGPLFTNVPKGDTSTPGLINNVGSVANFFLGDGDEEFFFSVPFVATSAGTVVFDVQGPDEPPLPPVFDALLLGINGPIPLADIDFIDATLEVGSASPTDSLNDLASDLQSLELDQGVENSLAAKLNGAIQSLSANNAASRQDAINKLNAFINSVSAQRGKKISAADADSLIGGASAIIDMLTSDIAGPI